MTNSQTAARLGAGNAPKTTPQLPSNFAAVSTNAAEVTKFGIDTANMFGFWGLGRRSLLDGFRHRSFDHAGHRAGENYRALTGRLPRTMDEHYRTAPFEKNLPVLMGLLSVWYNSFF